SATLRIELSRPSSSEFTFDERVNRSHCSVSVTNMSQQSLAALVIAYSILKRRRKSEQKRSCWVKPWIMQQSEFSACSMLAKELRIEDPLQFRNFVRMSSQQLQLMVELLGPIIGKKDTKFRTAISVHDRVMVTLRFLASGDSYNSLQYLFRIPTCTIGSKGTIVQKYEVFPDTREEWQRHAEAFNVQWNFPHCLGALDGKHIVIQAPANGGSHYFNYKGTHSIVLLGVANANYQFTYIDVRCNGRVSDGGVFQNCSLYDLLENGSASLPDHEPLPGRNMPVPHFFVADDAFAIRSYILKPYPFRDQPAPNRIFNYKLSRARRIVENAFGIMANKFRVLRKPINLSADITANIVLAVCALHNFLLSTRDSRENYLTPGVADSEHPETHEIIPGNWREDSTSGNSFFSLERGKRDNYTTSQRDVREEFKEYFMTPSGEVAWQYRHIV
ncbi:hypothetical protein J437_LFUL019072, partial [Ladona fulva]